MIANARRLHGSPTGITFQEGDAASLPFADATFDAVVMNFGMLHLAQPDRAIHEARRVLRPGGAYAFTVWADPTIAVGFGMVLNAIQELGRADVPLPEGPPFFRFASPGESTSALESAGFSRIAVAQIPLVWQLESADGVFDALLHGGVRTAAVLRVQTPEALDAIRTAVRREVERYERGGRFVVPMPAILTSARTA
jgi:SAM-dependent methyltransferase